MSSVRKARKKLLKWERWFSKIPNGGHARVTDGYCDAYNRFAYAWNKNQVNERDWRNAS